MPKPTYEQLEETLARVSFERGGQRRRADYLYTKLRELENHVRNATREIEPQARHDLVMALSQRVPKEPRPTLTQLRKRNARR